jgi:hypothetical protein
MYPAHAYVVREASEADARALRRLVELNGGRPLSGTALVGEVGGVVVAAISQDDGHVVADQRQTPTVLRQLLRMRLDALRAYSKAPSLPERLRAAFAAFQAAHASKD